MVEIRGEVVEARKLEGSERATREENQSRQRG